MVVAALLGLAISASLAGAAVPANDDFANREDLGAGLPVEATGSNVEATKEAGEPSPEYLGFAATGHTVWFEWTATSSGFVTVGTCGSTLDPVLGVYTGTAVGALTEVAGNFASLGPDCPLGVRGIAVTFRAAAGADYKIAIDGILSFPAGSGLPGQGDIALELAATPQPGNDDFANAMVLQRDTTVDPEVYAAGAFGFTWNATKEPGEPAHAGNPGGASVWYSWTAPLSGNYGLTACGRFLKTLLGVYTGSFPGGLTPVASDDHGCGFLHFDAIQGTTYRIAVDGRFDGESGSASMGSISINVFRERPEPPRESGGPLPILEPPKPDTAIQRKTVSAGRRRASFAFGSSEAGSRFRCKLDGRAFAGCRSPKVYRNLSPGRYVFKVAAVGPTGSIDPSPATSRFRISRPRPKAK